jgi:ribonuclease VapC
VIARGVVFDSSAVVAMMTREASAMSLTEQLEVMRPRLISAGTVLEVSLVLQQRFGESFSVEVVAFDAAQLRMARDASRRFGRGRHRAALNYGDCFSYALAMTRGLPLLFVGEEFAQTDVHALTS